MTVLIYINVSIALFLGGDKVSTEIVAVQVACRGSLRSVKPGGIKVSADNYAYAVAA